jgi:hypothetical protein
MEKWQELHQPQAKQYLREKTIQLLSLPDHPDDQSDLLRTGEQWISLYQPA